MISVTDAADIATKTKPNSIATAVIDYSDDFYVVEVIDKNSIDGEADCNSPYIAVSKATGNAASFTPMEDLDTFFEAVDNRITYLED